MTVAKSQNSYQQAFEELMRASPEQLACRDIAEMNLNCAHDLPGAEEMVIPEDLTLLNIWTAAVRRETDRLLSRFRQNPAGLNCPPGSSVSYFNMLAMVTVLCQDIGVHYVPRCIGERDRSESNISLYDDSKYLFLNGLLSEKRFGSCNSIPVLLVAIGRRLGYPLKMACTHVHVWARWDAPDGKERFNIDATSPTGMVVEDDERYLKWHPLHPSIHTTYYTKSFTAADDLALFLMSRAWVLEEHHRYREALPALSRCCFLAPKEPMYPRHAIRIVSALLYMAKYGKPRSPPAGSHKLVIPNYNFECDPRDYLPPQEVAMIQNIRGHYHEVVGQSGNATVCYKSACDLDPSNPDYAADFRRYYDFIDEGVAQTKTEVREIQTKQSKPVPAPPTNGHAKSSLNVIPSTGSAANARPPMGNDPMQGAAVAYAAQGLGLEQAGKLADAQVMFVRAYSMAHTDPSHLQNLARVVRKEVLANHMPPAALPPPKKWRGTDGYPDYDPRLSLMAAHQAIIWSERGKVLAALCRHDEAAIAFDRVRELVPEWKGVEQLQRPRNVVTLTGQATKPPVPSSPRKRPWAVSIGISWNEVFSDYLFGPRSGNAHRKE